jgi:hypothetical protein
MMLQLLEEKNLYDTKGDRSWRNDQAAEHSEFQGMHGSAKRPSGWASPYTKTRPLQKHGRR